MDKSKGRPPKKMSQEEADAQAALTSAVIRGYAPEVIEQLRKNLTAVQEKYKKKKVGEAVPLKDVPGKLVSSVSCDKTDKNPMKNVWRIESDPDYQAWFKIIYDASPLPVSKGGKLMAGQKAIGRSLVMAEAKDGQLNIGVKLNTGEEFWKIFNGDFDTLVEQQVNNGRAFDQNYQKTADIFNDWVEQNGRVKRLEFCSSHVGGLIEAIFENNIRKTIDDC